MVGEQDIHGAILSIMESLRQQGTSPGRIKNFENSYNVFEHYLQSNGIACVDEKFCLEYVNFKTGLCFERFEYVTANTRADYRVRPLLLLLSYLKVGQFNGDVRKTKLRFVCPEYFRPEYEAFYEEIIYRCYSEATAESNIQKVRLLIAYLREQGVASSANVTIRYIDGFFKTIEDKSVKYVGVCLYVFSNYLSFLYELGYAECDLTPMLSKVRTPRNASIPYIWSKEDIPKAAQGNRPQ